MASLEELLDRLEQLIAHVDTLEEPARSQVYELLDGIDALHRMALGHLADAVGPDELDRARRAHPAIAWLLDAYGAGVDDVAAAEAALEPIRPYISSHGGRVEVVDVTGGTVRVRLSGTCSGCTASSVTLTQGIEQALRDNLPGFVSLEAEEEQAAAHPPPGETLLQIGHRPPANS